MAIEERTRVQGVTDWRPRPTLTGADYTSLEVYEEERERLFYRGWFCIGRSDEVPAGGDYLVRDIVGESVFVVRNRDGELRAFYNVCAHRGTKLLDDEPACGNLGKALKCPYHAWSYDLEGRLLATPNVHEDEQFERADYRLSQVGVGEHGGFLFVSLAETPVPLDAWLRNSNETITDFDRYRLGELKLARRITYDVAANWKIVVENYNECLHCPQIHPELVQVIPLYRKGEVWDGETRDGGNEMAPGASSFTATGTSDLPKFPDLHPEDYGMYYGAFQFPNLMVNMHPEFGDGLPRVPERPGPDHRRLRVLLPTRSAGDAGLRSEPDRRPLGPHQPPGLGGLRARPARRLVEVVQVRRLSAQGPPVVRLQRTLAPRAGAAARRLTYALSLRGAAGTRAARGRRRARPSPGTRARNR